MSERVSDVDLIRLEKSWHGNLRISCVIRELIERRAADCEGDAKRKEMQ